ncbi:MAG: YgiT-type zinc finger protein [Caldilineae bacterium]|nr:MAG: YgiT-type zinc finger protein [Caldilineae bacterium]
MSQLCPRCQTGKLTWRKIVFVQWYSPEAIVVDRLPAQVCDTCGERAYDSRALDTLQHLLWAASLDAASRANNRREG